MVNLLKNEKIIKFIKMNKCFIDKINLSLPFFELGYNVIELVDVFKNSQILETMNLTIYYMK